MKLSSLFKRKTIKRKWLQIDDNVWASYPTFNVVRMGGTDIMFVLYERGKFVLIFDTLKQAQLHAEGL